MSTNRVTWSTLIVPNGSPTILSVCERAQYMDYNFGFELSIGMASGNRLYTTSIQVGGVVHHSNTGGWCCTPLQYRWVELYTTSIQVGGVVHHSNTGGWSCTLVQDRWVELYTTSIQVGGVVHHSNTGGWSCTLVQDRCLWGAKVHWHRG